MKLFALISLIFASLSAQAEICQPEAQIIAKVKSAQMIDGGYCSVELSEVSFFSPNMLCPLDLPGDARISVESTIPCSQLKSISGVIIMAPNGSIYLE